MSNLTVILPAAGKGTRLNSEKYKELYNNRIEIGWNRRAYNLSFYYQEDTQTGGINFKIHSFNFDGIGESFK